MKGEPGAWYIKHIEHYWRGEPLQYHVKVEYTDHNSLRTYRAVDATYEGAVAKTYQQLLKALNPPDFQVLTIQDFIARREEVSKREVARMQTHRAVPKRLVKKQKLYFTS